MSNGQVRSAERLSVVGEVTSYFPEVIALIMSDQALLHGTRIDVVECDPLKDIFRRILKYDNPGALGLFDNPPVAPQQAARRQRNEAIATVILGENVP